jgi:hypothetical protein
MLPLLIFRDGNARRLTMPPAMFSAPMFSLVNTLSFTAANLVVIPLSLAILVLYGANSYLAENASGFIRIGPCGVYMAERVYRRDDRTIRLAGMIHVGEKGYYDQLVESAAHGRSIVLAEGVTDERGLLRNRFDYGRVADYLGLTSQETVRFRGRLIEEESLEEPLRGTRGEAVKGETGPADILRADLDVSSFRPPTILLLDNIGKHLRENASLAAGIMSLNTWAKRNLTPEMNDVIMDDILHRRNLEVLRLLGKALDRYDTVVIPWGALHMKEIEAEVLKRGFTLKEERERVSIDFRKVLMGRMVPHASVPRE